MESYFRIRISLVRSQFEDDVTKHCFKAGASGVSEALAFIQSDLTYEPNIVHSRQHDLDVFFTEEPPSSFFDGLRDIDIQIRWQIYEEESKDWLEEWKKDFKPFKLVGPYWIVPSWTKVPEDCAQPVFIDPGMAFGTGTHATTQMAAYFVHKISKKFKEEVHDWSLLDVGTGTGVLAILAKHGGFQKVSGIEIDPEAVRVARENVKLNNFDEQIDVSDVLIEDMREPYNVVVANIIDGVLIKIKPYLLDAMKPGGHIFLTGILKERETFFFEKFIENSGLQVIQRLEADEWVGYWVQKT